jgi:hypothetical protein
MLAVLALSGILAFGAFAQAQDAAKTEKAVPDSVSSALPPLAKVRQAEWVARRESSQPPLISPPPPARPNRSVSSSPAHSIWAAKP